METVNIGIRAPMIWVIFLLRHLDVIFPRGFTHMSLSDRNGESGEILLQIFQSDGREKGKE